MFEARDLALLQDENRNKRKLTLKKLSSNITAVLADDEDGDLESDLLQAVSKNLLDSSEINRELSCKIILEILNSRQELPSDYYACLIPALSVRLASEEVYEECEEIRHAQLRILQRLVTNCQRVEEERVLTGWMTEIVKILVKTGEDKYHEGRKIAFLVMREFIVRTKRTVHLMAEPMLKPLIKSITHQHSKVRVSAIETLGLVVMHGGKTCLPDKLHTHLAQRLFDPHAAVRQQIVRTATLWLKDYQDRYSFWSQLTPLIFTCFDDEDPLISAEAKQSWEEIGLKYEKENEEQMKQRLEFPEPRIQAGILVEEPRFCLGCRDIVGQNLIRLLPGIKNELSQSFRDEDRLAAARLLCSLLLQAEQNVTQHFQVAFASILNSIDKCGDAEKHNTGSQLFKLLKKAAELLGVFTFDEQLWLKSVKNYSNTVSSMIILSAILKSKDKTDEILVAQVSEIILSKDVARRLQSNELAQAALLEIADFCGNFDVMVSVAGVTQSDAIKDFAVEILMKHGGFERAVAEIDTLVDTLDSDKWLLNSADLKILQQCFNWIMQAEKPVLTKKVYGLLSRQLQSDTDPENRVTLLLLLARVFQIVQDCQVTDKEIVSSLFKPSLKWKKGRSEEAARSASAAALWSYTKLFTDFTELEEILLPEIVSLLDDDLSQTRLIACKVVEEMINQAGDKLTLDGFYHKIYIDLAKRLDDTDSRVRVTSLQAWRSLFKVFVKKDDYDVESLYSAHWEWIFEKLLVHMDDPDESFRTLVFEGLSEASEISKKILSAELDKVRNKHKNQDLCEQLEKLLI